MIDPTFSCSPTGVVRLFFHSFILQQLLSQLVSASASSRIRLGQGLTSDQSQDQDRCQTTSPPHGCLWWFWRPLHLPNYKRPFVLNGEWTSQAPLAWPTWARLTPLGSAGGCGVKSRSQISPPRSSQARAWDTGRWITKQTRIREYRGQLKRV